MGLEFYSNYILVPLFVLWATIIISFMVGLPITSLFVDFKSTDQTQSHISSYLSIITGFSILHLTVFWMMELNDSGTDFVATACLTGLLVLSVIFIIFKRKEIGSHFFHGTIKAKIIFFIILPIASAHVLFPILAGKWQMAYSTGDDASRFFMAVDYFKKYVFEYWQVINETLKLRLSERPLQYISGSMFCSIFKINQALGYSLSSASSLIMTSISFCLVFEVMFPLKKQQLRYLLWAISIFFFGFFGGFINIYYAGRITQHFSIYPVMASLGFIAVKNKFTSRFVWFLLWSILSAYYYSIRYSINFVIICGAILFFQWILREITFKDIAKNAGALAAAFILSCAAAWGEVKEIVAKGIEGFIEINKESSYESQGTLLDRILKWSGVLPKFDSYESIRPVFLVFDLFLIALIICVAFGYSLRKAKKTPSYLGLIGFNLLMAIYLLGSENYFGAWKLTLFWSIYVLIGYVAFCFALLYSEKVNVRKLGYTFLGLFCIFILITERQLSYYTDLANERYTKVDNVTNEMVKTVSNYMDKCGTCKSRRIFGMDYSAERHLFLREVFKDFEWQPVRDETFNFSGDMWIKDPDSLDTYKYDVLVYANTFGNGEWLDMSGNNGSILFDKFPFKVFSGKSSLVELKSGMVISLNRNKDDTIRNYECQLFSDSSSIMFINNGQHNWLTLDLRIAGDEKVDLGKKLTISLHNGKKVVQYSGFVYNKETSRYNITLSGISGFRVSQIYFAKHNMSQNVFISKIKWGY